MESFIKFERNDYAATISICRESNNNALNAAVLRELTEAFGEIESDDSIRVVILKGSGGRAFSAGADLDELSKLSPVEAHQYARLGHSLTLLIENLGKPVIAAIDGVAHGGGCELAMACAWRIASSGSSFAQPEAKLGFLPGFGGTTRLPRLIGRSRSLELMLTGESIDAAAALRFGLINRVVADREELEQACTELAERISFNAPLAIKYALEAVNRGADLNLSEALGFESTLFALCFATEDSREGTRAFLEKRKPEFRGR